MADTMLAYSSGRSWLCAVALAVFDLDSGQKTEACVPEGELTTPELQAIAYGAFPVSFLGIAICHCNSGVHAVWLVHAGGPSIFK